MAETHCHDVNQLAARSAIESMQHIARNHYTERHVPLLQDDAIADLTQQIQSLQLTASAADKSLTTAAKTYVIKPSDYERNEQLAQLYCARAQLLLDAVDYDASVFVAASLFSSTVSVATADAHSSEPEQHEDDVDESSSSYDDNRMAGGVAKALDDAVSAIALAPTSAIACVLAVECARSLGDLVHAREFLALAQQCNGATPTTTARIEQLTRELVVDAKAVALESRAPPLQTPQELLAVFDTPNQDDQQQQDDDDDDSEPSSPSSTSMYETMRTGLDTLDTIASAPWLAKLEQLMHENVHHACASRDDVHALDAALQATASFLAKLLTHDLTLSALGLSNDSTSVFDELQTLAGAGGRHEQLVESRAVRKWIAQTLAPAVRRFPMQIGRLPLAALIAAVANSDSEPAQQQREAVLVLLVRDTLLVLTRVLLASAGWRRCTSMPHALLYAELCADVAKEIGASDGAFSGLSRFELLCSDAYARGLLELTTERSVALQLHESSLQTAIAIQDTEYELRSRHLVGQVLLRTGALERAQCEFTAMLALSRTLGDAHMESLAEYELGESCVQHGNLPQAHAHFVRARTLCHQTANAGATWRDQSVQQAIAFYAAMKPARRGAIRLAPARARARRGSFVHTTSLQQHVVVPAASSSSSSSSSSDDDDAPKLRRPAIWIGPPKLEVAADGGSKRSLMKTLLGEQTEPQLPEVSCDDDKQSRCVAACTGGSTVSVTEKLFRAAAERPQTPKRGAAVAGKPRRAGAWRDSVFSVPPSYVELRSLAASARSP